MEFTETKCSRLFIDICEAINSSLNLEEVLSLITQHFVDTLSLKAASIFLFNEELNRLERSAACGLSQAYIQKGPVDAEKSIGDALSGKNVMIADATKDPRLQYRKENKNEGIASILSVPMRTKGKIIGVLRLYTSEPRIFTDDETAFIAGLAKMGATAIQNARYFKIFNDICQSLHTSLRPKEVLSCITRELTRAMKIKACAIFLINRVEKRLDLSSAYGLSKAYINKGHVGAEKSIVETLDGEMVWIEDATTDARAQYPNEARKEGIVSILSVPIFVKDSIIGALRLYTAVPYKFTENELQFISSIADLGGIAIENARIYDELKIDHESLINEVHRWFDYGRMP